MTLPRETITNLLLVKDSPRIFSPQEMWKFAHKEQCPMSERTLKNILSDWKECGFIRQIAHGLYMNMKAIPVVLPDESASKIRKHAVVGLQRVLGASGVLNNPSLWITCVLPYSAGITEGLVQTESCTFHFTTIKPEMFPSPTSSWFEDAMDQSVNYPRFTPEKSLLDWMYLHTLQSGATKHLPPFHDIDKDMLDKNKLDRLASALGLQKELKEWWGGTAPSSPKTKKWVR